MASFESAPRISPFLWFNGNAEEAVDFYISVFKNSRRVGEWLNDGNTPGPKGTPLQAMMKMIKLDIAELERAAGE